MAGDYTRATFKPERDHAGVLMQQGRVTLDADWNELVELIDRRLRAETIDIIGRCVVPLETPDGFRIGLSGGTLTIGRGRAYVHGILAECHGADPQVYDAVLGEEHGTQPLAYDKQPYFPNANVVAPLPTTGTHIAYLDVWRREVTALENPDLIEKAIAVDTATRLQTAWQVRLLEVPRDTTCDSQSDKWDELTAPSAGRLTTNAVGVPVDDDPCTVPPTGGYRGTENRLYRVEIHDAGPLGTATFKWSRDNGSIAFPVTGIDTARTKLTVTRVGRDSVARISIGDWVEVTDDWRELNGLAGELRKVAGVDDGDETITLASALPAGAFDPLDASRHTRVRRWDQSGAAVDAAGGVVPVPAAAGSPIVLEDGVEVAFDTDPTPGSFHVMDYWVFAARTADASVEILTAEPPRGILHHYCRLAIVTFPSTVVDCRTFWPPDFGDGEGGHDCGCAACVTPESHASGQLTIQMAVDQVKGTGGKVCLQPGFYFLDQAVRIDGAQSLALEGKGWRTILVSAGREPAIVVQRSLGVAIDSLTVLTSTFTSPGALPTGVAIGLRNTIGTVVERCVLAQIGAFGGIGVTTGTTIQPNQPGFGAGPAGAGAPLIAMDGFVVETLVHENVLVGTTGVGSIWGATFTEMGFKRMDPGLDDRLRSSAAAAAAQGSGYLITFDLIIEENLFLAFLNGVSLEGFTLSVGETRIDRNSVIGAMRAGIVCNGLTLPAMSRVDVTSNLLQVLGFGIAVGTDDTRIADNDVFGLIPPRTGTEDPLAAFRIRPDGIALVPSVRPAGMARCQVRGNRLGRLLGNAIAVRTEVALTQISHNTIQGTAGDGITMTEGASAENLVIEGNQVFAVSLLEDPGERGAGILLQNGIDVAAIGNTINRVGGGAPAGILGHNCLRLRILDNDIGDIGKPEDLGEAFGIVVSGVRVDIQDNAIRRVSDPSAKPSLDTSWWGIMVFGEEPKLAGGEPPPGLTDMPGFVARTFAIADSLSEFVFDATRGRAVELPRGRPAIAVQGNRVEAVGGANAVYMQTTGSCSFSDNRCFLETRRSSVVKAFAGALVASDNYLEGPQDVPAADFTLPGGAGFTVSGNLGSGPIELNGGPLPSPWNQLNVP
jgi:hypothetical protein